MTDNSPVTKKELWANPERCEHFAQVYVHEANRDPIKAAIMIGVPPTRFKYWARWYMTSELTRGFIEREILVSLQGARLQRSDLLEELAKIILGETASEEVIEDPIKGTTVKTKRANGDRLKAIETYAKLAGFEGPTEIKVDHTHREEESPMVIFKLPDNGRISSLDAAADVIDVDGDDSPDPEKNPDPDPEEAQDDPA